MFTIVAIFIWIFIFTTIFSNIAYYHYDQKWALPFTHTNSIVNYMVFALITIQIILDLWSSEEFKIMYRSFKKSAQLRSELFPLSTAYRENEQRIIDIVEIFDKKIKLDESLELMDKQLKIWNEELSGFKINRTKKEELRNIKEITFAKEVVDAFDTRS